MDGKVTIKTIAQHLGVSQTTVSRVLNGVAEKYRISEKTKNIVLTEAKRLGYIPNMAAKILRSNESRTIGLLLPSLNNPFFSLVASTVSRILYKQDYVVLINDYGEDEEEEKKMLQTLISQNLIGLLVIPMGKKKNYDILRAIKIPTVFIDRYFTDLDYFSVATDHYMSSWDLMQYLINRGHQKIACIQGNENVISNQLRVKGYKDSLTKHALTYFYLGGGSFTSQEGYLETKILLQKKERPTAILALSDTILLGVLKAINEENLRVPSDISVVSIDNSDYLGYLKTPVTSASQPVTQIAQLAAKLMIDLLKQQGASSSEISQKQILLESTLIIRNSVAELSE